jgi:lipoprotein-anchoring transpeptidase ErfK/SrfK
MRQIFYILMLICALAGCTQSSNYSPPAAAPKTLSDYMGYGSPAETEQWIQVDLALQLVRLYNGETLVAEYPIASGLGDSPSTRTYTGTFTVYNKIKAATYLPEFGVYVTDWVGFDQAHAIGFHSLPQDRYGQIVDSRLGIPASHGCIRVGNAAAVYAFAKIGMRVIVR